MINDSETLKEYFGIKIRAVSSVDDVRLLINLKEAKTIVDSNFGGSWEDFIDNTKKELYNMKKENNK